MVQSLGPVLSVDGTRILFGFGCWVDRVSVSGCWHVLTCYSVCVLAGQMCVMGWLRLVGFFKL